MALKTSLEDHFAVFRNNIIGNGQAFDSPFGKKEIVYADWTASGRAYQPIEGFLQKQVMPFLGNTHTGSTITGSLMSRAYEKAKSIIRQHVNANNDDALVFCGSGMTAAVNKLQRILGMRAPERMMAHFDKEERPIVFITHMEHHSNQVSWLETIADVEIIPRGENGHSDLSCLKHLLGKFSQRKNKIAAVTACSNVTGIQTPYQEIARIMHADGGLCFVDFACSAPYVHMDMHPPSPDAHLDAIYFSPHKFLGGPGTPGVLVFNKKIYSNKAPDQPGGGTVTYSNPWKYHEYVEDIGQREDGGTPPFLQGIKAAMCVRLKEEMGIGNILQREEEMLEIIFERFAAMKNVEVLESGHKKRLGVVSFIIQGAHHNAVARILNDRFGIQIRGGCSCAGTYGHTLLGISKERSYEILGSIHAGNLMSKPGWARLSIHPVMTDEEIDFIMDAVEQTASHWQEWIKEYAYDPASNEWAFKGFHGNEQCQAEGWFDAQAWGNEKLEYALESISAQTGFLLDFQ